MVDCQLPLPCTQIVNLPELALAITNEAGDAVQGNAPNGVGVTGLAALPAGGAFGTGVQGTAQNGIGVLGTSVESFGVIGSGGAGGVQGNTSEGTGVLGNSTFGAAGVFQIADQPGDVQIPNPNPAVLATTGNTGPAVEARTTGTGNAARFAIQNADNRSDALDVGTSGRGTAAVFHNDNPDASTQVIAVSAASTRGECVFINTQATGLFSVGRPAGIFVGDVSVSGTFTATDKRFVIDHPLDPANRYLVHASVESSEQANVYTGNAVLDDNGEAVVTLPEWVEALNGDFRYQLTCIGRAAAVYVAQEVSQGAFTVAGGSPGMKVSWQLVGVRKDPWARAHPLAVEAEKSDDHRGRYLHPELVGEGAEKSVPLPSKLRPTWRTS